MSTAARVAIKATPLLGCAAIALTSATFAAPIVRGLAHPAQAPIRAHRFAGSGVTLYGGGATLPALAYEGMQALTTNPGVSPFAAGTVFGQLLSGVDKGDALQYCQTGSGYGKGVLNGLNPANGPCAALNASPTGFGVPSNVQNYADFSGSDSPVSQSDYSALMTGPLSARGEFVQVPYIAGSVAIFYNNSSLDNKQLTITPATLCKIADGEITNWNQIPVAAGNPSGKKYPSKALTFVYRYDGSGTTFSFGNYLSALNAGGTGPAHCTSTENYGLSQVFDANNNSKGSGGGFGVLPNTDSESPNFLAGSGNPGVISCILATQGSQCYHADTLTPAVGDGSIGYVEAANAAAFRNNAAGQNYADLYVNTGGGKHAIYDPIVDLSSAAKEVKIVGVNEVVAAPLAAGRPNPDVVAVSGSTGTCLGIVDPASYDNIKTGYPIIAVTNLEFTSAGNGVKAPDLRNLATFADTTNFPKSGITSVDKASAKNGTTGYSEISLPVNAINALASCIN